MTGAAEELRPFAILPRGLAPLGFRNYAFFWVGYLASNTGRWIELTGSVWLVYLLTDSPVLLGLLGIVRAVPSVIISPIAGVIADRVDQRRLLFGTQTLCMIASLAVGILIVTGRIELWHVYLQVAIQAAITSVDQATRQALFPRLVPRTHLPEAVTLSATAARLATLAGPAIGGFAIAGWGEAAPFFLNAACLTVLMVALVLMTGITPRVIEKGSTFRSELVEGLRYILDQPVLSGLIKMEIVFGIFSMNAVLITIVGLEVLGVGPEGLGGLLSAPAVGSLVAIAGLIVLGHAPRPGRFVIYCTFVYSAALVAFALSTNYWLSFAILAVTGFIDALVTVTRHSLVQLAAPGRMRGRVMANMGIVTRGLSPLAQTQSGFLAGLIGPSWAGITAAIALASAAAATGRFNHTLWDFSLAEAINDDDDTEIPEMTDVAAAAGPPEGGPTGSPTPTALAVPDTALPEQPDTRG